MPVTPHCWFGPWAGFTQARLGIRPSHWPACFCGNHLEIGLGQPCERLTVVSADSLANGVDVNLFPTSLHLLRSSSVHINDIASKDTPHHLLSPDPG